MTTPSPILTTVVTFALPDESRAFRARLGPARRSVGPAAPQVLVGRLPGAVGEDAGAVAVVHVGMGDSPAQRERLERFLAEEAPAARRLIAAGFAGALRPGMAVGELLLGENFSDPGLLATARRALAGHGGEWHVGALRTETVVAETTAAKAALHAAEPAGALAVDMETAWVAEVATRANVPALALRVISDAADQDFPVPGGVMFDPVRQRPRYLALPAYLATHPARIGPFVRFVRGLGPARERLAEGLQSVIRALGSGSPGGPDAVRAREGIVSHP